MEKKASVTVTFSLVLTLIISMLLVTLEHAYVKSGHVIVYETLNKAMESVLGNYSAPLYTQYGLMALPMAPDEMYTNSDEMGKDIADTINGALNPAKKGTDGFIYQSKGVDVQIDNKLKLTDDNCNALMSQIREAAIADAVVFLGEEIGDLKGIKFDNLSGLLSNITGNEIKFEEDSSKQSSEEKDAKTLYDDLLDFLNMGFASMWFGDVDDISHKAVYQEDLPSFELDGEIFETSMYGELEIDESSILDGSYIENLIDDSYLSRFIDVINDKFEYVTDDLLLATYANLNLDNYINDKVDGKLKYEQEYVVFGSTSDAANIKEASWAIFGIRLAANLLFILSDDMIKGALSSIISSAILGTPLGIAIIALLGVVLAVENAIVETAALLKGKNVVFIPTALSQCVTISEMFNFSKRVVQEKALKYQGGSGVALGYGGYLYVFMLMTGRDRLVKRILDIIDINMKKIYNEKFDILQCYVGFSCKVRVKLRSRFYNIHHIGVKNSYYDLITESAIQMPQARFS